MTAAIESLAALRDAGAFALSTPARFDGLEADLPTIVRVISECGRGPGAPRRW